MYILRVALRGLNGRGHLGLYWSPWEEELYTCIKCSLLVSPYLPNDQFHLMSKILIYHNVGKIVGVCKCFLRRLVSRSLIRFCRTCAILYNTVSCLVPKTSLTSVDKCLEPGWKFLLLNIRIRCVGAIDTSMLWSHRCCNLFICSWNQLFLNARTAN